jgi:hypothetical protein
MEGALQIISIFELNIVCGTVCPCTYLCELRIETQITEFAFYCRSTDDLGASGTDLRVEL